MSTMTYLPEIVSGVAMVNSAILTLVLRTTRERFRTIEHKFDALQREQQGLSGRVVGLETHHGHLISAIQQIQDSLEEIKRDLGRLMGKVG